MTGEPTWRLGEEEHPTQKDGGWNDLDTPRNAEGCRALARIIGSTPGKGRAVLDEVLDEDTPGDGPLLEGHDTTANLLGCDLGLVDGYDGRCDTDTDTGNDPTDDQQGDTVRGSL